MENYHYEQILPVKKNADSKKMRVVIIIVSVLVALALNLMLGFLGPIVSVILLVVVFKFVLPLLYREYEYAITNNFLQIATIYNKENRKENMTIDIREVELIAPTNSVKMDYHRNVPKVQFVSGEKGVVTFSILTKTEKGLQNIVIEPDDRLVELMKRQASINMYLN